MAERAQRSVPRVDSAAAVQITMVSHRAILRLKSWMPMGSMLGGLVLAELSLPYQIGIAAGGPIHILCVGPGEWLLMSDQDTAQDLCARLVGPAERQGLALVDWTDAQVGLDVWGPSAAELLSKGCGLDLHIRSFPAGRCARTRFAQVPVVIERLDKLEFELHVACSLGDYLRDWLCDAAHVSLKA